MRKYVTPLTEVENLKVRGTIMTTSPGAAVPPGGMIDNPGGGLNNPDM